MRQCADGDEVRACFRIGPYGVECDATRYFDRRAAINEALEKTRYNRTAAAKLLGITFRAMRYRMERLGIK